MRTGRRNSRREGSRAQQHFVGAQQAALHAGGQHDGIDRHLAVEAGGRPPLGRRQVGDVDPVLDGKGWSLRWAGDIFGPKREIIALPRTGDGRDAIACTRKPVT